MQYIDNQWHKGEGDELRTINPATGMLNWRGNEASFKQIEGAICAAHQAFKTWSRSALATRIEILQKYAACLEEHHLTLAECIAEETGKPLWESRIEVAAMIGKIQLSIEAYHERTGEREKSSTAGLSVLKHRPLGVMAILGPFNFPGHLPNGHIVPALLAGNTIVFKPSEFTPQTAIFIAKIFEKIGCPPGVVNVVLGKGIVGKALVEHPSIKGVLFTGSYETGKKLHLQCAGQPEKLLALEMGGNNPLIIWDAKNTQAVAYNIIQSAFISAGQRCTCARRLIINDQEDGDVLLAFLKNWVERIQVAYWRNEPEPFMGPVITHEAAKRLLKKQESLREGGGEIILPMRHLKAETGLLTPGIIDVTHSNNIEDIEFFGPLLQVIRVKDFEQALLVANNTQYGLAAGLQSDSREIYEAFYSAIQAGVLSWNRPTTGASSAAPFGGIGHSGNYRPGGYYAADYCAYPVVSTEIDVLQMPANLSPGV